MNKKHRFAIDKERSGILLSMIEKGETDLYELTKASRFSESGVKSNLGYVLMTKELSFITEVMANSKLPLLKGAECAVFASLIKGEEKLELEVAARTVGVPLATLMCRLGVAYLSYLSAQRTPQERKLENVEKEERARDSFDKWDYLKNSAEQNIKTHSQVKIIWILLFLQMITTLMLIASIVRL